MLMKLTKAHLTGSEVTKYFDNHFGLLWYASLPCFDVENITSGWNGEKSILKTCFWKGKQISCAAIFKKVPTDQVLILTILACNLFHPKS